MKVLFLTNIPSPYRVEFFNELGKQCDLTVLYEMEQARDRDKEWKIVDELNYKKIVMKSWLKFKSSSFCPEVISFFRNNKYDAIIVGGYSTPTGMISIVYMSMYKIPFILNCDGGMIKNELKIKKWIKQFFISKANAWLSTGNVCDNYLQYYGAKLERIFRFPFTSLKNKDILERKLTSEEKEEYRKNLHIETRKVVLSVGQLIYRKGYDLLLEAAEKIEEDCSVYIIGGKETEEYKKILSNFQNRNVKFYFEDFKKKEELENFFKIADIFVLPTREDIWGLVINEAMAYGLPIITTDKCVAGLELIEDGKNGYLVESENIDMIAERINWLLKDDILCNQMGKKSLKKIKDYTIEKMVARHLEVITVYS